MASVTRTLQVGGLDKAALLAQLQRHAVSLNDAARALFAHERFVTSAAPASLHCVELSVAELGGEQGAAIAQIRARAAAMGLQPCPMELGPHFRLQFLDQPEGQLGHPPTRHCAPPGSITVVSEPLVDHDDEVPKGFYLRRIAGELWLRGYRSGTDHQWSPQDRLLFCRRR